VTEAVSVFCLDTNVFVKALVEEEPAELTRAAEALLIRALLSGRVIAPAFAWAEVGSTLRKKVRHGIIDVEHANTQWTRFRRLPIEFVDSPLLRDRAWELAERYRLPNLCDAAFLACTETFLTSRELIREFWTADEVLLRTLSNDPPPFVHRLQVE
jgi:predicted nucleic acid-binding protein